MKNNSAFYLFIVLYLFCCACEHNKLKEADVSSIKLENFSVQRLEDDIFSLNPDSIALYTPLLQNKYGTFYLHYIKGFINNGGIADSGYAYNLSRFITDKDMREAYAECKNKYPSVSFLQEGLEDAFKHYKYYFPEKNMPKVLTMFTGFNYSIVYVDTTLAISLEMYLGKNNKFYNMMSPDIFPMYRRKNMEQQYIIPDAVRGWLSMEFSNTETTNNLLSEIIQAGKILYLTDALLPFTDDTLKIGYSKDQLEWCNKNEFNMWAFFIDKKLLFSTDINEIMNYTADGPFTAAFNKESPARVGHWIGWKIVRAFMKNNEEVTPAQLVQMDSQTILNKSRYKPGK